MEMSFDFLVIFSSLFRKGAIIVQRSFPLIPWSYWDAWTNRRVYLDNLATSLNIRRAHDLYSWSTHTLTNRGGGSVLVAFNSSPYALLTDAYPELAHVLYPWRFNYAQKVVFIFV